MILDDYKGKRNAIQVASDQSHAESVSRSSSELEAYQKQIDELREQLNATEITHQRAIDQLLEERNQAREQDLSRESSNHMESQTGLVDER